MTNIARPPATEVHKLAQAGFNTANELYDKARPSYPPEALQLLRGAVKAEANLNIVEIGSGSGIFTRALLAHPAWKDTIGALKAFEPSEGMRQQFDKTIKDERVSTLAGTFDSVDVPDGWADMVVIAQAFHWCPDHDSALKEFARVLKPSGIVAFIWNLEDRSRASWVGSIRDIYESFEKGSPQFRLGLWKAVFDEPAYHQLFLSQETRTEELQRVIPTTVEGVVERVCSKSYIAVLGEEEKAKVIEGVKGVFEKENDRVWMDESKGVFEYPYNTVLVIMRRK